MMNFRNPTVSDYIRIREHGMSDEEIIGYIKEVRVMFHDDIINRIVCDRAIEAIRSQIDCNKCPFTDMSYM